MRTQGTISLILFVILIISIGSLPKVKSSFYNNTVLSQNKNSISLQDSGDQINLGMLESANREEKKEKNNTIFPNEFTTNFITKNRLIFVNANLNGKDEQFLLDSGLGSNLILNSEAKHIGDLQDSDMYIDGIGGSSKNLETTWISSFNWMGIKFNNADIVALPLSHLDENNNNLAGIIGFNSFSGYQLTFDYGHNIIKGRTIKDLDREARENGKLLTSIPFELKEHMPVFEVEINGYKYKMGLDTGATTNLMNTVHFKNLEKVTYSLKGSHIVGFNGESIVKRGSIAQTNINNVNYDNMIYSFDNTSLKDLNRKYGFDIDGILGYEFLSKYITVVDFSSKEIRVYDGKIGGS